MDGADPTPSCIGACSELERRESCQGCWLHPNTLLRPQVRTGQQPGYRTRDRWPQPVCCPTHASHLHPVPGISVCLRTGCAVTGLAEASMASSNGFFLKNRRSKPVAKAHANEHIPSRKSLLQSKGLGGCVFLGPGSRIYPILSHNYLRPIRCQASCGREAITLMSKATCLPWHKLCSCYSPLFLFFCLMNSGSPYSPGGGSHQTSYLDGTDRGRAST